MTSNPALRGWVMPASSGDGYPGAGFVLTSQLGAGLTY
jgi:hypothetical protein